MRAEFVEQVEPGSEPVRDYLAERVGALLDERLFREALPGHLPGDAASQRRVAVVLERLRKLARRA